MPFPLVKFECSCKHEPCPSSVTIVKEGDEVWMTFHNGQISFHSIQLNGEQLKELEGFIKYV
jgi:hypothetical protein